MTFGFGSRRYIWMLAVDSDAGRAAVPGIRERPARTLSAALLFTAGFAVFIAVLNPGRQRWWAAALVMPVVVVEITHDVLPEALQPLFTVVYHLCVVSFLAFVVALILLRLFHKRFLEIDDVIGAFAGYMIVAVLWGKSVLPNRLACAQPHSASIRKLHGSWNGTRGARCSTISASPLSPVLAMVI